ncbi:MAG: mannitol-1-phosphate 5-dehydrogenase, partial [Alkalispirochaetaceae bacterium]
MSSPKRLVQFGAGNIGRSFVGQIFGRNGWEVVFVDVDRPLIEALNRDNAYQVVVRHPDGREERITVPGVRGVDARDDRAVAAELEATDYVATSVGAGSISHVAAPLARESLRRWQQEPGRMPFDLILAENIHDGAALLRKLLFAELPAGADPSMLPAIVECSV